MTDLHEVLTTIADRAPQPPPDLLDRVEAGHRRRRRRHSGIAAFTAVVVLAAGSWAVLRPGGLGDEMTAGFTLPSDVSESPLLPFVWPAAASADTLPNTLDGGRPAVLARVGYLQLLVAGRDSIEDWDGDRYRPRYDNLGYTAQPDRTALSPRWIVSVQQAGATAVVWRYWVWGGSRQRAAEITVGGEVRGVYATDDYAYLSATDGPGVMRVTLDTGESEWLAGFDDLVSDGSGWARSADGTVHRHLGTGEERRQPRPPDVRSWTCVPAFCLGQAGDRWFLEEPGGERETLPYPGTPNLVGAAMDSGILRVAGGVLLDPKTGKFWNSRWADEVECDAEWGQFKTGVFYRMRMAPDGGSCDGPWSTIYL